MKGWLFILSAVCFLLYFSNAAYTQKRSSVNQQSYLADRALERIKILVEESFLEQTDNEPERAVGADLQLEEAMEYFGELLRNPLKINGARRSELERLLVLSQFQIESILNYRAKIGYIMSAAELSLLHGFDNMVVELILPFISFELPKNLIIPADDKYAFKDILRGCSSQLYFKGFIKLDNDGMFDPISKEEFEAAPNSRYLGTQFYMQMKYKLSYASKITAGFTLENDIGEPLFPKNGAPVDFFSFNVALNNIGKTNTIIIGDYTARFGQGLVLWNSFSLKNYASPSSLYRRGSGLLPYSSSDENNFFRGVAASCSIGKLDINAMFSNNRLDARIEDGKYTSIIDGGLHNTLSLQSARKSMKESVGAFSLKYLLSRVQLGFTLASYGYDKKNGRRISDYNRYQIYDGVWGNASVDYYAVFKNLRFFGELAVDFGGSVASLAGAIFPIRDKMECGLLLRSYSKSYIAPHAGAYSTLSSVSNQHGVSFDLVYRISNSLRLSLYGEPSYYPWKRYNINSASYMLKEGIKVQFDEKLWSGYINLAHTCYSHNGIGKLYLKSKFTLNFSETTRGTFHGAFIYAESYGFEVGSDWRYRSMNRRFTINGGVTFFRCNGWSERLYIYENDLPYTYNSRLLYGNGVSFYILLDYTLCGEVHIYLKNGTQCYFSDNKESQSALKLALKLNF